MYQNAKLLPFLAWGFIAVSWFIEPVTAQDPPAVPTTVSTYTSPKAVITPEPDGVDQSYEIGDVGWLSATGSDFEALLWDLSKAPPGTKVINSVYVQFPTKRIGTYAIGLVVAKNNPESKKPDLAQTTFVYEIYSDTDPDVPDVTPTPDKPDTKPEIKPQPSDPFKAAVQAITVKYAELPTEEKPKVATAFRNVVKQIEQGQIVTKRQLVKNTADEIIKLIGVNAFEAKWIDWRNDVVKATASLSLPDMSSHAKPWTTIADVLDGK